MSPGRFHAILDEEVQGVLGELSDRWLVWAAELWDHREHSGQLEVVSPDGDEAGLRALLRVKLAKGLDHEVTPEDIIAQVEADPLLRAAIQP